MLATHIKNSFHRHSLSTPLLGVFWVCESFAQAKKAQLEIARVYGDHTVTIKRIGDTVK